MRLAKYVKFREEKFGGVLFETRSEKVYTLNPTAVAVVREIAVRRRCAGDRRAAEEPLRRSGRARSTATCANADRRPARDGPGRGLTWRRRREAPQRAARGARRRPSADDLARAALRRVADHQRVQPRLPALHRGERAGQGVPRRARRSARSSRILDQMIAHEIPYLSFSGGEPMLHPHFFEMVRARLRGGGQLKIETNGHYLTTRRTASGSRRSASRPCR